MQSGIVRRLAVSLTALAVLLCMGAARGDSDVVVFLLDSEVDRAFLRGDLLERRGAEVSHGSLVGRVVSRYCSARMVPLTVEESDGSVSRGHYLAALDQIAETVRSSPGLRVVVNVSLASDREDAREAELVQALQNLGVLIVAAAGNDGRDVWMYPAALDGVIAVAAADEDGRAPSSNFGRHIDICASGDITFIDYDFVPYERLRREMEARGTSFAAPRVAATVAFVLEHDPGLSPRQAFDAVAESALPIDDDLYRQGLLGVGLLDVRRTQTQAAPAYGFFHYTLPWLVCGALTLLSVWLCLRHGAPGVFLSLLLWLVGLPLAFLFTIGVSDSLRFLGAGNRGAGFASVLMLVLGVAGAALIQGRQLAKGLIVALPGLFLLTLVLGGGRIQPVAAVACAAATALLAMALAVLWEQRSKHLVAAVHAHAFRISEMRAMHGRTVDRRIRQAVRGEIAARDDPEAVAFFLHHVPDRRGAVEGLTAIAQRHVRLLLAWVRRLRSLTAWQRRVLLLALERGAEPEAAPLLADVAGQDPSGRIARLAGRLGGGNGVRQGE